MCCIPWGLIEFGHHLETEQTTEYYKHVGECVTADGGGSDDGDNRDW